jgi:tetrahydromethanopterin S-methyltransferase subunit G
MPSDVTRDEFQHLQVRVDVVEREVEGEKMVTRHILEQTRRNSDDLATIKARLDRVERSMEQRFDQVDKKFDQVDKRFDQLDKRFDGLAKSLPGIVSEVVREVFRKRDR